METTTFREGAETTPSLPAMATTRYTAPTATTPLMERRQLFVFGDDAATNRVTDFTHGVDLLDISNASYDGKGSGISASGIVIAQNGADTDITLHLGATTETTIVLQNFTATD